MSNFILKSSGIAHNLGAPFGLPPFIPETSQFTKILSPKKLPEPEVPGQNLPRAVNYLADYGGCSWYRCMSPNLMLNLYQKAVLLESTTMIVDPRYYQQVQAIKIQRQATPAQKEFVKHLKQLSKEFGFKIIYEIDDIV